MSIQRYVWDAGMRASDAGEFVYYYDHLQEVGRVQQQLSDARDALAAAITDLEAAKAELRRIHIEQAEAAGWRP